MTITPLCHRFRLWRRRLIVMSLKTTLIGCYPKPDWFPLPSWQFCGGKATNLKDALELIRNNASDYDAYVADIDEVEHEKNVKRAVKEVIREQEEFGFDVITDGEQPRDNYINHFCRSLDGFDFKNQIDVAARCGAYTSPLPAIRSAVCLKDASKFVDEWHFAQSMATLPVKYTLPGPMTIGNTSADVYYESERDRSKDLVIALNKTVRALADAGCKYIQIDEPLFARRPDQALEFGISELRKCFDGIGSDVVKVIHLCCGYPLFLDQEGYQKADPEAYLKIAPALDSAGFDRISIEDAHRHNDLKLFSLFKRSTVILGVVQIHRSRIDTADEIEDRIKDVLQYIPASRLMIAPDCGLAYLSRGMIRGKLTNLHRAVQAVRAQTPKRAKVNSSSHGLTNGTGHEGAVVVNGISHTAGGQA